LHIVFHQLKALMPRLMERPKPIGRELIARSEERRFAQSSLKRVNRPAAVTGHEKTEPIELRQTLREDVAPLLFQAPKL
jgi:hypothetical protein